MNRNVAKLAVVLLWAGCLTPAFGQGADPTKPKIPLPEDIELKAKDGLTIKATYYAGLHKEKTVPIIMLHGWKGNRTELAELAKYLQVNHGHAVLVPDLRGHGDSTQVAGSNRPLDAARLRPDDYDMMVVDMEVCKKFLREKNNAKECNIEKLCVLGAEMGAIVAMNWAVSDWKWPPLAGVKQGQDVKAVVLLSPEFQVPRGRLNMASAIGSGDIQRQLSVALLYGGVNSKKFGQDAERIQSTLNKFHMGAEQTFFFDEMKTSLQGVKLLAAPGLSVKELIAKFIELRLVDQNIPWNKRVGAFGES